MRTRRKSSKSPVLTRCKWLFSSRLRRLSRLPGTRASHLEGTLLAAAIIPPTAPPNGPLPNGDGTPPPVPSLDIENELRDSYLTYAMSVIVSRALPDVRDG